MRNGALALIVVASLTAPLAAQQPPWAQKIFDGVSAHDFGTCPRGAQLRHRFTMKNIYAVPLEITNIRSSCGCVTATASSMTLQPQEEGYIDVLMDGRRFTGQKAVTLYVTVGPQYISTATFQISANARADVVFNPGEVNFGVVRAGAAPTQMVDVEYAGELDWRIVEVVKSKSAPFTVSPRELYRDTGRVFKNGKAGYQIAVTLKPDAPAGPFQQKILLKTNDPNSPVLTVCVEGTIQASLSASPQLVNFGVIPVGQPAAKRVVVRGERPFRIVSASGIGGSFRADLPDREANLHVITVNCTPAEPGALTQEVVFVTDSGDSVGVTLQAVASK